MKNYQQKTNYLNYILWSIGFVLMVLLVVWISKSNNPSQKLDPMESLTYLVGQPIPDFTLKDKNELTYSPETLKGKNVVLFFNEGLQCYPACWNQIAALGTDERFNNSNTISLSVVPNSPWEWNKAYSKMPALTKATVLFDNNKEVSRNFGVLNVESSMHSGALPGHTYIIVDKSGVVRYFFDDSQMGVRNDELIGYLNKLNK